MTPEILAAQVRLIKVLDDAITTHLDVLKEYGVERLPPKFPAVTATASHHDALAEAIEQRDRALDDLDRLTQRVLYAHTRKRSA